MTAHNSIKCKQQQESQHSRDASKRGDACKCSEATTCKEANCNRCTVNIRDDTSSSTVKGADNMWSQNSMRTCTVAILVTPNWNSASVETGGTNQYRAHCIHLSLAVPIRRKFRFLFKNSWCRRSQTIFSWCRRNEWETTFASVYFSWSWRS